MTVKRSGLGRNLSALLSSSTALVQETVKTEHLKLAVHCLEPGKYQPRKEMDEHSLNALMQSIKTQGVLQPLLVRELPDGRYEIIAGERRWRASIMAGLTSVPVILKQVDDKTAFAIALVENLQRDDLNAMEQAEAMHRLTSEFGLTHQQIGDLLSKSRTAVSNYLRLLSLSESVKKSLALKRLEMGHARALLMLEAAQQSQAAELIIAKGLSVRETEALVQRIQRGKPEKKSPPKEEELAEELKKISLQLNTSIQLKPKKSGKGSLVIHYEDLQSLREVIAKLSC